jgi:hypothetical protein
MSTKTSFKRIALVAVAALGMGVLTSVSPAHAAASAAAITTAGSVTSVDANWGSASSTATLAITSAFTADADGQTLATVASITSPSGAAGTVAFALDSSSSTDALSNTNKTVTNTSAGGVTAVTSTNVLTVTADKPGTYTVALTGTGAGGASTTVTFNFAAIYAKTGDGLTSGTASKTTVNGVAGPANTVTLAASGQGTTARLITISGTGSIATGGTVATGGQSSVLAAGTSQTAVDIVIVTPTVGTATVSIYDQSATAGIYSATPLSTVTITVNAAAQTNVYNAAKSTFYANTGGGSGTEANNTTYSAAGALSVAATLDAATEVANVTVTQKDGAGTNLTSGFKTVSATITGAGLLSTGSSATGASVSSSAAAVTTVAAYANGTVGKGVLTVSVDGVVVKTITITFYGTVAKLTATVSKSYIPVSTTNAAAVISVLAVDSLDQPVADTPVITSATGTVISSGTCAASNPATPVNAICTVTSTAVAGSSVLTITAGGAATVTTTVTINVSKATANTAVLTTNKATYVPGEEATLTLTLTDADGKPLGSSDLAAAVAAGGLKVSSAITTSLKFNSTDTTITVLDGKATVKFFVPTTPGPVTISGTLLAAHSASSADKVMTPVTFTVSDSATMSALTTLINSLIAKINALNKLVIKIQKKVKA